MFPTAFDYVRVDSVEAALDALASLGGDGRILAGGQSLIPAMRYRLARPTVLVDINPIAELNYIHEQDGHLNVGAMARDAALEMSPLLSRYHLLADCSAMVADPVVRFRGTVVGSLCHNDPSGDWGATALAARAVMVIRGKDGTRLVPMDDFIVDSYTTAVQEGEMAIEIRFPTPGPRTSGAYEKIERKVGDYATAAAAVQITLDEQGLCTEVGVAITALGPTPLRVTAAENILRGQRLSDEVLRAAAQEVAAVATPNADGRGSAEYKTEMGKVLVERGLRKALKRLEVVA